MISNRIKVLRAEKGITQEALADAVEVTRQTIVSLEQNKYNPSLELSFKISRFFQKPLEEVFSYEKNSEFE